MLKVLALDSGFPSGLVQAMRDYKANNYYVVTALNTVAESDNSVELAVGIGVWPTLPDTPSGLTA
jgi:hypothetical protein